jgi:hypothetical protein
MGCTHKFGEQLRKAGRAPSRVRSPSVQIERLGGQGESHVSGSRCCGFQVRFGVTGKADTGRLFERERVMFVSPHDASIERQSVRPDGN